MSSRTPQTSSTAAALPLFTESLPNEILLLILDFLSGENAYTSKHALCQASLVSKRWCGLAQQVLYRNIAAFLVPLPPLEGEQAPEDVMRLLLHSEEYDQLLRRVGEEGKGTKTMLETTLRMRPELGCLVKEATLLHYLSITGLDALFPNLKELRLSMVSYDLRELLQIPSLETLAIEDTDVWPMADIPPLRLPSLRNLEIYECSCDMEISLANALWAVPCGQLKSLCIARCREFHQTYERETSYVRNALRPHIPFLECFDFSIDDCKDIDERMPELTDILNFLPDATRLLQLTIGINSLAVHLPVLLPNLPPSLTTLQIVFFSIVSDDDYIFRITETRTFADAFLDRLRLEGDRGLPRLKRLYLRYSFAEHLEEEVVIREKPPTEFWRDMKAGMIEHCVPLMQELERRGIEYNTEGF